MKEQTLDQIRATYRTITMIGILYLIVTFVHFGIQFYDLDRLISNMVIGILVIGIGWVIKEFYNFKTKVVSEVKELRIDVKAISKLVNDLLNKK